MYKRQPSIPLKASCSALCNNLDVSDANSSQSGGSLTFAVVHKSVSHLINSSPGLPHIYRQVTCKESESSWCALESRKVLVIASLKGIQMFEPDGSIMLFWHALNRSDEKTAQFARGITSIKSDNLVCVGTSSGSILIFSVDDNGKVLNIQLKETLSGHDVPITDLISGESDTLASADELGNIAIWKTSDKSISKVTLIKGQNYPCSSIRLWDKYIIGGYGSGHIRIYEANTGNLEIEIAAHARWVNAIDVAFEANLLLSASEDTYVRVWSLGLVDNKLKVEMKFSESVTDVQLQGCKFTSPEGLTFALTGYDFSEIYLFSR
ncbi:uncharacterized protein TRIADDRAFT_50926 [Trichoplax adhaerens]|uniref:WD repeat-containing protein 54 beta-propeller domain-containing protein n=1 Tax=Trichoplax adhaerens TaxID=10228 RepID=B3S8T8_TRIAD|nr:hypothetical protein TRIADDRAFT_50926 [Trichoplax adhaerens]EDV20827.1 hypothetical protein TRIADDRAFT_50926 [Trichoplax adhaerens]|eukprot:XP_002116768.1 hypothetical protein TRIADDRAFT_50926 [Trichoplax adhaerens]